jgi:hypothetical protein
MAEVARLTARRDDKAGRRSEPALPAAPAPPPLVSGPLAEALARGRDHFNARIAALRRATPRFSPDRLVGHLAGAVRPVVDAVAAVAPDRVQPVVEALFEISARIASRDALGPAAPLADAAWARVLTAAPGLVADAPDTLARAVTNAAYNIARLPSARPADWIARMTEAGPACPTTAEWLACGTIAAWTSGLAHLRQAALLELERVPRDAAHAALGLPSSSGVASPGRLAAQLRADPWLPPSAGGGPPPKRHLRVAATLGGFRGLNGPFLGPPDVVIAGGQFVVFDARSAWTLHADACGATLVPAASPATIETPADAGFTIDGKGRVTFRDHEAVFPELADVSSAASNGDTLVATVPRSFHVFVVAPTAVRA